MLALFVPKVLSLTVGSPPPSRHQAVFAVDAHQDVSVSLDLTPANSSGWVRVRGSGQVPSSITRRLQARQEQQQQQEQQRQQQQHQHETDSGSHTMLPSDAEPEQRSFQAPDGPVQTASDQVDALQPASDPPLHVSRASADSALLPTSQTASLADDTSLVQHAANGTGQPVSSSGAATPVRGAFSDGCGDARPTSDVSADSNTTGTLLQGRAGDGAHTGRASHFQAPVSGAPQAKEMQLQLQVKVSVLVWFGLGSGSQFVRG